MNAQDKDQRQTTGTFPINDFTGKAADQVVQEELCHLLSGSLREKPIAWLLQAAKQKEVIGQLLVGTAIHMTTVQLVNGKPIHAQSKSSSGAEAIFELFVRDDAKVKFESNSQPTHATIRSSFEDLFSVGQEYKTSLDFLSRNGITESDCLTRAKDSAPGMSTEAILAYGFDLDIPMQLRFLQSLSGTHSIKDLAIRLSLPRSKTMIICANLLKLGLALAPSGMSLKSINIGGQEAEEHTEYDEEDDYLSSNEDNQSSRNSNVSQNSEEDILQETGEMPTYSYFSSSRPAPPPHATEKAEKNFPGASTLEILPDDEDDSSESRAPENDHETHGNFMDEELSNHQVITSPTVAELNSNNAPKLVSLGTPNRLIKLDEAASRALERLKDPETGVLDSEAFQFFLEFQFARAFRFGTSFSLVSFAIITDGEGRGILPSKDLARLLSAVDSIKRDVDIFGNLGDKVYAFILPNVTSEDASNLAERILSDLDDCLPELTVWKPRLHFGIASIPQDARDLANLVENAQLALIESCKSETQVIQYKELQNRR